MSNAETFYINSLRYRAPQVVPLPDGRFAVLTPGMDPEYSVHTSLDTLHPALMEYIEWNVSDAAVTRTKKAAAKVKVMDQIMDLIKDIE